MKFRHWLGLVGVLAAVSGFATPACAQTLFGDSVTLTLSHSNVTVDPTIGGIAPAGNTGVGTAVVGAGNEFDVHGNGNVLLDISDGIVSMTTPFGPFCGFLSCNTGDFFNFVLADLDFAPAASITSASVLASQFDTVLLSFGPDSLSWSLPENDSFSPGEILRIGFTTAAIAAVPEPGSLALLALPLLALGFFRPRRRV